MSGITDTGIRHMEFYRRFFLTDLTISIIITIICPCVSLTLTKDLCTDASGITEG